MARNCQCLCHNMQKPSINLTFKNLTTAAASTQNHPFRIGPVELQLLSSSLRSHIFVLPVNQSVAVTAFKSLEVRIMNLPSSYVATRTIGTNTDIERSGPLAMAPSVAAAACNRHVFNSTFRPERHCTFPGCSFKSTILRSITKHRKSHFLTLRRCSQRPLRIRNNMALLNHIRNNYQGIQK